MLEEDAIRFDTFLKENDKKAHEAIKKAERETKVSVAYPPSTHYNSRCFWKTTPQKLVPVVIQARATAPNDYCCRRAAPTL